MPDISFILVNYRGADLTADCVRSIYAADPEPSFEIIIVDNCSGDGSGEKLRTAFPEAVVVDSGRNGGFAFGCNTGVRHASGRYILLLNNDTRIFKGMPEALIERAVRDNGLSIVGCRSVDGGGRELTVGHGFEDLRRVRLQSFIKPFTQKLGIQRALGRMLERGGSSAEEYTPCDWISGACMLMTRELYLRLGGLDENFFMYMEDEDLCRRALSLGVTSGVVPFTGYVHLLGGSSEKSYKLTAEYMKSRLIFFKRYEPENFERIKRALLRPLALRLQGFTRDEAARLAREMDEFCNSGLEDMAGSVRGIGTAT